MAKTRSTNPVMKAARGLLSREMPLVRRVRARGLVRYGVYALRVTRVVEQGF